MRFRNGFYLATKITALVLVLAVAHSCTDRDVLSLTVNARGRGVSVLAMIIAKDQGLYEKYGLNVTLLLPPPPNERSRISPNWIENLRHRIRWRLGYEQPGGDIYMVSGSAAIRSWIFEPNAPHRVIICSMDCKARTHIIGRKGIAAERLEDLAGLRIGGRWNANESFHALLLAERMGRDPGRDFEYVEANTASLADLEAGTVDALFGYEYTYSNAVEQGYPILFDTADWNAEMAGNSMTVDPQWLSNPTNREATKRFLMAVSEAVSLLHDDRALSLQILDEWNSFQGEFAERIYDRGAWLQRKPSPCVAGLRKTLDSYGVPEIQAMGFRPLPRIEARQMEEYYDESLIREIDETGFFEALYP